MTTEEKAKELVNNFLPFVDWTDLQGDYTNRDWAIRNAKKCALITIDELIKETGSKYWYTVKLEINKL